MYGPQPTKQRIAGMVVFNIFYSLRKNFTLSVISLGYTVSLTEWKNIILKFPSRDFNIKWLIKIPKALLTRQLLKAIIKVKGIDGKVETPGASDNGEYLSDDDTVTSKSRK